MNKKGFTLIELLSVIVVFTIIIAIAIPIILGVIDKSKKTAFKDSVLSAYNAIDYALIENKKTKVPVEGISISELKIKGNLTGGKYILVDNKPIAEFITNGEYCAYGELNNLIITKDCNSLDTIAPKISTSNVIEGTKTTKSGYTEWFNSDKATIEIKLDDYYLIVGTETKGGSGIDERSLTFKLNNVLFTPTKVSTNLYKIEVLNIGLNKLEINVADNFGNKRTIEKYINIDNQVPTLSVKNSNLGLGKSDYNFTDNLNSTYGPSGGTTICDPAVSKKSGTYNVTCTAHGNNGKDSIATVSFNVKHSYSPTVGSRCTKTACSRTSDDGCKFTYRYSKNDENWGDCSCSDGWNAGGQTNCWHCVETVCTESVPTYSCPNGGAYNNSSGLCEY